MNHCFCVRERRGKGGRIHFLFSVLLFFLSKSLSSRGFFFFSFKVLIAFLSF